MLEASYPLLGISVAEFILEAEECSKVLANGNDFRPG